MDATSPLLPVDDPLGAALHHLRMDGACYFRSELTEPWRLNLPPMAGCLWFHVVTTGRCWLAVPGAEPRLLQPGELALVPHGQGHDLWSEPALPAPPAIQHIRHDYVSERYAILRHGGGGAPAGLVCGAVRFGHPTGDGLMALLPPAAGGGRRGGGGHAAGAGRGGAGVAARWRDGDHQAGRCAGHPGDPELAGR